MTIKRIGLILPLEVLIMCVCFVFSAVDVSLQVQTRGHVWRVERRLHVSR